MFNFTKIVCSCLVNRLYFVWFLTQVTVNFTPTCVKSNTIMVKIDNAGRSTTNVKEAIIHPNMMKCFHKF